MEGLIEDQGKLIEEMGLRGTLERVVLLYPNRSPGDCYAFGTVDGEHWYGISVEAKPGMEFDGTLEDGSLPLSITYRWFAMQGRVEEVAA